MISLFMSLAASAQNICNGVVVDKQGTPIANAKVEVVGTEISCLTDFDGAFSIDVPTEANQLRVVYIGMVTETVKVKPNVTVTMQDCKKSQIMVSLQSSYDFTLAGPTVGFAVGQLGKVGWYAKALCNVNGGAPALLAGGIVRMGSPVHFYLGAGLDTSSETMVLDTGLLFRCKNSFVNIGTILDSNDFHKGYTSIFTVNLGIGFCF